MEKEREPERAKTERARATPARARADGVDPIWSGGLGVKTA